MEPLEAIDALARRARAETPPQTHINVHAALRAAGANQWRLAPLAWSAGLSAIAACIVVALALHGNHSTKTDSIEPLFDAAQVQMP